MGDLVPRQKAEVAPIGKLHLELAEAKAEKSLPRLQRVIGAATVAAEAQRRVARLADGQGSPIEVVDAAREASRQAAAVQLEATAEAGRLLREMAENGQRAGRGGNRQTAEAKAMSHDGTLPKTLTEMGIDHKNVTRWGQIGDIPDEVRERYIFEASAEDQDVTAAGLLRYAAPRKEESEKEEPSIKDAYREVMHLMGRLNNYRAAAIAAYASDSRNKTKFRQEVDRLEAWLERVRDILK